MPASSSPEFLPTKQSVEMPGTCSRDGKCLTWLGCVVSFQVESRGVRPTIPSPAASSLQRRRENLPAVKGGTGSVLKLNSSPMGYGIPEFLLPKMSSPSVLSSQNAWGRRKGSHGSLQAGTLAAAVQDACRPAQKSVVLLALASCSPQQSRVCRLSWSPATGVRV